MNTPTFPVGGTAAPERRPKKTAHRNRLVMRLDAESEAFVVMIADVLGAKPAEVLRALVRKERAAWEALGAGGVGSRLSLDETPCATGGAGVGAVGPGEGRAAAGVGL